MFIKNRIYRHTSNSSLDILVLNVRSVKLKRTKLRIMYITRWNKEIIYTGKGPTGTTDIISIQSRDFKNWKPHTTLKDNVL